MHFTQGPNVHRPLLRKRGPVGVQSERRNVASLLPGLPAAGFRVDVYVSAPADKQAQASPHLALFQQA
jgi:hypothetical protein